MCGVLSLSEASAVGANPALNISARPIPQEPMVRALLSPVDRTGANCPLWRSISWPTSPSLLRSEVRPILCFYSGICTDVPMLQ